MLQTKNMLECKMSSVDPEELKTGELFNMLKVPWVLGGQVSGKTWKNV